MSEQSNAMICLFRREAIVGHIPPTIPNSLAVSFVCFNEETATPSSSSSAVIDEKCSVSAFRDNANAIPTAPRSPPHPWNYNKYKKCERDEINTEYQGKKY